MDMGMNPRHGDLVQLGVTIDRTPYPSTNQVNRITRMRHITRRHPHIEHTTVYPIDSARHA